MSDTKSALDILIDECLCVKCECGIGPCDEIANRDAARAELAALRERVARHETIASAGTAATLDALFDPIHDAVPSHGSDCSQNGDPDCCPEHLSSLSHAELVTKAYNFAVGLVERVAKLEVALVKADEMEVAAANVGHCLSCGEYADCDIHSLYNPRLAYRTAREATK